MKNKLIRMMAVWAALAGCLSLALPCRAISAASAIVMDADTERVLYELNADERSLIASTTKIMTGYLACESCDMESMFTVPPEAVGIEGSSIYLQAGETISCRTLLYGTMLQSGNDAATALAIATAGDVTSFVAQMNETARKLSLYDTHYANPHGLDSEDNYSTARDLARLTCAALKNPVFAETVATKTASCGSRSFVNHNKLLWRCEGAIGVKTGYTKAAGRILVSAVRRDGRTLVAVTIDAPDDWNDHAALYDDAFSQCQRTTIAEKGKPLLTIPTADSRFHRIELLAAQDVSYPLFSGETVSFELIAPSLLLPPFQRGTRAGEIAILVDGRRIARIPVVCGATVLR